MCTVTGAAVSGRLRRGRAGRSRSVLPDRPGTTGCSGCHRRRLDTAPSGSIRHAGHRPGRVLEKRISSGPSSSGARSSPSTKNRRAASRSGPAASRDLPRRMSDTKPRTACRPGSPADRVHRRPFEFGSVDGAVSGYARAFLGAGNVRKSCYNALRCGSEPGRVARSRFTPRIRCRGCTAGAERSVR
jgi:hypothetical protein